jgi:hypothetical protein
MSDLATGPLAGYLFQFEKALLLLANLEHLTDYVTIESVDDIATHAENGTVIMTVQAKHSISNSGTTFQDTSYALWRTLQIWIEKLENKTFDDKTKFICSTNKVIPSDALLNKFKSESADNAIKLINELLKSQQDKLSKSKKKDSPSIEQNIKLIEFALSKETTLRKILPNLEIEDNESVKEKFFTKLHLGSDSRTEVQKDTVFESFYGWITTNSKAKWNNADEAKFFKKDFDEKWHVINSNPAIMNAVFRAKKILDPVDEKEIQEKRKELFVRQIEDINRNVKIKEQKIRDAILDFIYAEIEMYYIIGKGNFTSEDFDDFLSQCEDCWKTCYAQNVIKEFHDYTDDEKNSIAIKIYDTIMDNIQIKFGEGFTFSPSNTYVRNGSFLQLSNEPKIGWHPEWETKYKK